MWDSTDSHPADIRITDPDLLVIHPADSDTVSDYKGVGNLQVDVVARFYNMGTGSLSNLAVYLYDDTDSLLLDTEYLSFDGLGTDSCWKTDSDVATFSWTPDSNDIGVHRLRVYTAGIINEPDTEDNTARLVSVVEPRDYSTEVLDDPWDMTEATTSIPDWYTNDITAIIGWSTSLFTDSISGMFEGGITDPTELNRMFLNTGSDSSEWIDADNYVNLSLAGKATLPLDIELHWVDSDGDSTHIDIGEDLTPAWREISPVDLSGITGSTWGRDVAELWIELIGGQVQSNVGIGWIKLTE